MAAKTWSNLIVMVSLMLLCLSPLFGLSEEQFEWRGSVAAGQTVEVKGVNGKIEAGPTNGSEVEIVALKKGKKNDPGEVEIQVVPHEDGITICAVYPSSGEPNECRPGKGGRMSVKRNDVQVNFTVLVPPNVHFVGRTVNGNVSAEDLTADVQAYTVNGDIDVSCDGTALAQTVNGSIEAAMYSGLADDLSFETVNGSISVRLPSNVDADVVAATVNGSLETDFPLTVKGKWGPKKIKGTLGAGGPELSLKTVNGNVRLLESAQ